MASKPHLLNLPREIRDQIIAYIFVETPFDTLDTRRAELRIYNNHAMLHRLFVVPPPSFKGCSKFFRSCKQLHHEGMSFLYSQVHFLITIDARLKDFPQRRSRLHSEYPVGELRSCSILRHMRSVDLNLIATTGEDMLRLGTRLRGYLLAISRNNKISTMAINVYFDSSMPLNRGQGDEIANMLKRIKCKARPTVHLSAGAPLSRNTWDGFEISQMTG